MTEQPVILYIEDDANSRRVVDMVLSKRMKLPYVTIFEDSTDFMNRIAAMDPQPDIILLDIHMEPYDGFHMLQTLRESGNYDHVPIVALTASVMNEEVNRLQEVGFHSVMSKPVNIDTFPDMLTRIMGGERIWTIID